MPAPTDKPSVRAALEQSRGIQPASMIPHHVRSCNGYGVALRWGDAQWGCVMEQQVEVSAKEPPASHVALSFPTRAFGFGSSRYRAFLEALVDGLCAYEAAQEGTRHASASVPAA